MLNADTKKIINSARDVLVGKIPDPKAQVEQITFAMFYKFMDEKDNEAVALGGKRQFFTGEFESFSWSKLMDPRLGGTERMDLYTQALAKMSQNPHIAQLFRDIYKDAFIPFRSPETLSLFLKEIDQLDYTNTESLGDAFEYLLSVMGSQGDAGQFRTPRHIIDFIVEVVNPQKSDTILDPACGTAGFLISSYKHIVKQHDGKDDPENKETPLTPDEKKDLMKNLMGYDISPDMVRLSKVNLYLHGLPNPTIYEYDTLSSEEKWDENFDVILANPPFMSPKGGIKPHKRFSIQANRAEVLFVDYIIEHLKPNGRAGIIVPEGIIFQSSNAYKDLRKKLIEDGLYCVASLPSGVFNPYAGVKTSILFFDKKISKRSKHILFVKINSDGFDLGAQRRENGKNDLPFALEIINKYRLSLDDNNFNENGKKIAQMVSREKIVETKDYNLSGERYREVASLVNQKWPSIKIVDLITTITPPTKLLKSQYQDKGKYPIIDQSQKFIAGWTDKEKSLVISDRDLVIFGDHTCSLKYIDRSFAQGADGIKILKTSEDLLPKYFYYYLKFKPIKSEGYKRHFSKLKNTMIPLPPVEVQKEIVEEIENYQKIIDGAKQVVENWKPSFKIDNEWPVKNLSEVCNQITDGTHRTPKYTNDGIPFLRVTDITESNTSKKYISKEEHAEFVKRCKPDKGDVLYTKNGTIGIAKMIDWDYEFSIFVSLALLKPKKENLNGKYLEHFLNSEYALSQSRSHSKSGTITNLHLIEIKQFNIPLPQLNIQKQIAEKIENEKLLVESNKKIIEIFEEKITDIISKI